MPHTRSRREFLVLSGLSATAMAARALGGKAVIAAPEASGSPSRYYVAPTGSDQNPGTLKQPFRTVQKAADAMQPGDTCLVRSGVYRERINPPRGGTAEERRITFKAYPGDHPVLTGSERITAWKDQGQGVWMVELPASFFGEFNPYTLPIYGDLISKYKLDEAHIWLNFGQNFHLGQVYFEGTPYLETLTKEEMQNAAKTWYTETGNGSTRIWAHFEGGDPNRQLSEINVRETVFFPDTVGLNYITVSGFTMRHAAVRWASPVSYQLGLIGTHLGKGWIVERCHISDSKCVGVCSGGVGTSGANTGAPHVVDIEQLGHHIVRDNTIERCGEAAVAGFMGFAASLITNNLIQDINFQMQFGGQESAGIKVHEATDLIISHNIIRRVFSSPTRGDIESHFPGMWIDWANQGTRITGNVIYDVDDYTIFIEADHGPLLIDNNILVDSPIMSDSERVILAHNLFCNSGIRYQKKDSRSSAYFQPHTLKQVKTLPTISRTGDRYYNNIFIAVGADRLHSKRGAASSPDPVNPQDYRSGSNVYYNGATRQPWDESGIENDTFHSTCQMQSLPDGAVLHLTVDRSVVALQCPLVDTGFIGPYSVINQGMEQHDGSPIRLDRDYFGEPRNATHPRVGPFEKLKPGPNTFTLRAFDNFFTGKLPSLAVG